MNKYKSMTVSRVEELLSLNIDVFEHSKKYFERAESDPSLKSLMKAQMDRLLPEIIEMQGIFNAEDLITKKLLLKSQIKVEDKASVEKKQKNEKEVSP